MLDKLGQGARAALMFKQARSLREHDARADYALARQGGAGPAPEPADPQRPAAPGATRLSAAAPGLPYTEVESIAPGRVRVRRVATADATVRAGAPSARTDAAPPGEPSGEPYGGVAHLEIRNGNGVAGVAAATARLIAGRRLQGRRLQVIRLANEGNFQVLATRVEYGDAEQEAAARALAGRLGASATAAGASRRAADLRLILGHDLSGAAALRRRYLKSARPG